MPAEPLIQWSDPIREYISFVAQFLALGAVGFRYAALRRELVRSRVDPTVDPFVHAEHDMMAHAARRAGVIGLLGALVQGIMLAMSLPGSAAKAHTTVSGLLTSNLQTGTNTLLLLLALVGLAMVASGCRAGWPLAVTGMVGASLTDILVGRWSHLANAVHRLAGGLWLGTLFVLVVAGLGVVLRDQRARDRRGAIAARMVNGFSPLALTCGMIIVLTGVITAWLHLNPLSSLWTTPYGYALIAKLTLVSIVFGFGAWNWKRQRPTLGSEEAAHTIKRSSKAELTVAALVLVASAVLVSLPSPKPPRPAGAPTQAPPPGP
ncbi:MAG: CopD family protein [Gemmatimonadota bacterium]|nr:CopD family protein [Gemmatimonadota bacterium]